MGATVRDFPLFPLGMVALPTELVPLHVFEQRYRDMLEACVEDGSPFGIVYVSDEGQRPIGCAMEIVEVMERFPDGRFNVLTRGTRPFRVLETRDDLVWPAGTVELLDDKPEEPDAPTVADARAAYAELVRQAADREADEEELGAMGAYAMAATVECGPELKQGLLDLRSENARLRLITRFFRAAVKRLDFIERAQARASSNGKVRFG